MGNLLAVFEAVLEVEALVFLLHDFDVGPFWRVFLPLAAHLLALALLAVGFLGRWDFARPRDRAWAVTGLCVSLPLPMLGFLGFVGLYALYASRPRGTGDLLRDFEDYISYDPDAATAMPKPVDSDRFILAEVDVAPLRDVLAGTDVPLKRGAILSLSRLPRREAVTLLKTALADENREIRYYAGNALSEMEREFNDRIFRLVREVERAPTRVEHHIKLAGLILDYADIGLLDQGMVRYFADIGLKALDKATLVGSSDGRLLALSGRLHRLCGQLEHAEQALTRHLDANPGDLEAAVALAETAYERGNVALARRVVEEARARFPEEPRLTDLHEVLGGAVEEPA